MLKKISNNEKIDIVIPWVDGSDPNWQIERDEWLNKLGKQVDSKGNNDNNRYENWENLHYWFRAVEQNMAWFNRIFFVTWGHVPKFLNTNHPKLKIVNHKDYIPLKYLPTFNACTIEMNLHRIEDLSENFIYFNDDMFPVSNIEETYYFQNDQICDEAIEQPIFPKFNKFFYRWSYILKLNNMFFISKHFDKREVQAKNYNKWFNQVYEELLERNQQLNYWNNFMGFRIVHVEAAFKKSTFRRLWEVEPEIMDRASQNKFRANEDVNQWLARHWQICEGNFVPKRVRGKFYLININNVDEIIKKIHQDIEANKYKTICIGEYCTPQEFIIIKSKINNLLETLFPKKCSFEK